LASLLDAEQKRSEGASAKEEKPKAKKAAPKKKAPAKKAETASSEKKEEPKEEVSSEAPAVSEKPAAPKKTKKTKAKAEESIETPKEEKAPSKSTSKKKKEKTEASTEPAAEEKKEESGSAETSEKKEEKPEAPEKKSRGKKGKKAPEEVKAEEKPSEESTEAPAKEEEKPSEEKTEEKKENANQKPSGKNKKSRHRSFEIRPANETAPAAEGENANGEEKPSEGEAAPENNKPQIEPIEFTGILEIVSEGGYGFVRRENYLPSPQDVFVPTNLIRRFGLRMGDQIKGFALPKRGQDKNLALSFITTVNDVEIENLGKRPHFERLTPIYPDERFRLETGKQELSTRIIDLVSPIGKGQRGMIVSPPKAGKTILLQKIANAITQNSPKTKLIVLLIDERPEEVTDMQRSIKGEVVYSTFDKKPENHTRVTELVLERAMRLVEMGEDVVILLDSMTRLARAYNLTITPTGRTLSGGLDPGSLYGPKRFFGAARNIENGGSLTIVATSLIETGSRMDEVIFEEFKGTGNMEVYLDRKLSEKRIFPAIDINKSGTRREDLLMSQEELDAVWTIRKAFSQMETAPVTETIINLLLRTNSNDHFIRSVKVSFADKEVFDAMRGTGSNGNGNANS
ncbi:MAG: transcription termination factor Rho, partial [Clostridiales bacterium]|nr:transcription termination factor Rho [Clostridiales bacterium]